MSRDSRSRSVRRAHRESGTRRSPRRSPTEISPRRSPRDDSRRREGRKGPDTSRYDPPSSWAGSSSHWDTKTEHGLNFPKRVESTQFSRRQKLAGQEISQVKLVDVIQSGISNWGLRLVTNETIAWTPVVQDSVAPCLRLHTVSRDFHVLCTRRLFQHARPGF